MMSFKQFMQQSQDNQGPETDEEQRDIAQLLSKLPQHHSALVKGYHWKFHAGNTLNGDSQHVGYVDPNSKEIAVAGPWNYGREFTILHEVGHKVWERYVQPTPKLEQMWSQIVARTKNRQDQPAEELFAMAYANHYVKNKIVIHTHPEWEQFVEMVSKITP